ncbi:MAG: PAS domain S-box protein [Deltaproteobacteria bacterium]|nr:MAG: PAS domain S-box protein [Deltaproteobacteria bacterium]
MVRPRIVVIAADATARAQTADVVAACGFPPVDVRAVVPPPEEEPPDAIVLAGPDAATCCDEVRARADLAAVPVLAVAPSAPADAAAEAIAAGADDVVLTPYSAAVFGNRLRRLLRGAADRAALREAVRCERALRHVHDAMERAGDAPEGLRAALVEMAAVLDYDRAALIAHIEGSTHGFVIAATDDPTLTKFRVEVERYPELVHAMRTREHALIDDTATSDVTRAVRDVLSEHRVGACAVFPAMWGGRMLGVVLFRREKPRQEPLTPRAVAAGRLFAGDVAAHLADGRILANLREQTHRISRARYEHERRLRAIDTVREYFESSSDGVVVLDGQGRIEYVNRSAEAITGFARDGLLGTELQLMVADDQRAHLREVIDSVLRGTNVEAFDIDLLTTSGRSVTVSAATSTVLSAADAVILQFRDVSAERLLEYELRKTKDFLERLIDSTVDAIVAADIKGNIILFNSGAERIMGYSAEEMIGKARVTALYPDGVAHQVMRMLRSPEYGGVGKLEPTRRELVAKSGELVPVSMTASVIYEGDKEVATVGIFSDLRDRIRMEKRLMQAQQRLIETEKQGLIAELAGAAAHELNQPLTSILGYLELIQRQSDADARHARHIATIRAEAERMAEIVKKIGRITRYETKEYVGGDRILDLDKAASSAASFDRLRAVKAPGAEGGDD